MAREILFKAKRISDGKWIEGFYVAQYGCHQIYLPNGVDCENGFDYYHIDINTLCQYTGLTDKNGNKIWENDVVNRNEKFYEIVKYFQGDYVLDYSYALGKEEGTNYCNLGFYCCEINCVEVIGNIFDNPELLGGGE